MNYQRLYDKNDKLFIFDNTDLNNMMRTNTWYNSIIKTNDYSSNTDTKYKLHATGDIDLTNGRKYIALPSDVNPKDPDIKRKYNLM